MPLNNLTKEEMKSYIKISNLLEENKKDIDKILSINRDNFSKDSLFSSGNSKHIIFLNSFALSLLVFLLISCLYVIFFGLKGFLISGIIGVIIFLLTYISLVIRYSYIEKTLIKLSDLLEKISTENKNSLSDDNLINALPNYHSERYYQLKDFFIHLNTIGYFDNYLTPQEKNKINKIKKEKETLYQKIKDSKEPIEKEFWEMKLKEFENANSKYLKGLSKK